MTLAGLDEHIAWIRKEMGDSADLVIRRLKLDWPEPDGADAALVYLEDMADRQQLQDAVIAPLLDRVPPHLSQPADTLDMLGERVLNAGNLQASADRREQIRQMMSGAALLLLDDSDRCLIIMLSGMSDRGVTRTSTQNVVKGPQDAFTETLATNITLIRRRILDSRVRVVKQQAGTVTKTEIAVMYIEGLADPSVVAGVFARLGEIRMKGVLDVEYIEELIRSPKPTLFPSAYNSERPDTVSAYLLEGRIAILVNGTPFVLVVPAVFLDFVQSAEDYYQSPAYSNLVRLIRLMSIAIALLMPAFYIAVTTHHPDIVPTQLLLSLAAQREDVPFPAFIEAVMMALTFEILQEAGIRMPSTIGQAVSIVGTIVIGQAAVEADIVSAAMVIIVAITGIASFVIPSYALSLSIRIYRFIFMFFAAAFGIYGLTVCALFLCMSLARLDSFGVAYLSPFAPYPAKQKNDALLRPPFRMFGRRKRANGGTSS